MASRSKEKKVVRKSSRQSKVVAKAAVASTGRVKSKAAVKTKATVTGTPAAKRKAAVKGKSTVSSKKPAVAASSKASGKKIAAPAGNSKKKQAKSAGVTKAKPAKKAGVASKQKVAAKSKPVAATKSKPVRTTSVKAAVSSGRKVAGTPSSVVSKKPSRKKAQPVASAVAVRSAGTSRRGKEKEKPAVKSPFSHTDHEAIFRGVAARKAAARAKQARLATTQAKPKKSVARRLTDKQLVEFEDMLLRIRAELLRQIAYLRGASLTRSDEVNPEEDGTDAFERQLALKLAAGEGDSIFEIDEALDRIREKTYGVCEDCGCIIPTPRLKALPFARRCVACQSKIELIPNLTDHRYY
ncbi:MAG: TraR/DksA C4-type zinc finger protein [Kiritimatiellia bacterium]